MVVRTVCCIGSNDIGILTCFVIAAKCPEIRVIILDKPEVIGDWNSDVLPICDADIEEIVRKCRNRNLFFNSDYPTAIRASEVIFVSIKGTVKLGTTDEGISLDLKQVEDVARKITTYADSNKVVVEKSTTPAHVAERITMVVQSTCEPGIKIDVLSNPEFLSEGSLLDSLLNPERVIIGCARTPSGKAAAQVLSGLYERWISQQKITFINMSAAEEIKLIGTALLVQRTCTLMVAARICKETGVDASQIKRFVGLEGGRKIFGDLNNVIQLSECLKVPDVTVYWNSVRDRQKLQENMFLNRIKPVKGKNVAILGLSTDPDTKYEDPNPIETCRWLLSEKANVNVCDPKLQRKQLFRMLNLEGTDENESLLSVHNDLYKAVEGTSIIISYSSLNEYSDLSFQKIYKLMENPKTFISGLKLPEEEQLRRIGFQYENISPEDKVSCTSP